MILLFFFMSWLIIGVIAGILIPSEGLSLLAVLVGFGGAYGLTALAERRLKRHWSSGRVLQVQHDGVRLTKRGTLESDMPAAGTVSTLLWRFQVKKRARIPKGWWMFACALEHEQQYLVAYTFLPPAQAEVCPSADQCKTLLGKLPYTATLAPTMVAPKKV